MSQELILLCQVEAASWKMFPVLPKVLKVLPMNRMIRTGGMIAADVQQQTAARRSEVSKAC